MSIIEQIQAAEASKLRALAGLHRELGYGSAQELAAAIVTAADGPVSPARKPPTATAPARGDGRRGRRVPDSVRSAITAALKAGETSSTLPGKFGVSYNIIHEVKKKLGMVNGRGGRKKR